ncbi:hypothetical protein GCM10025784_01020 [Citricoccus nitrophenolicus]
MWRWGFRRPMQARRSSLTSKREPVGSGSPTSYSVPVFPGDRRIRSCAGAEAFVTVAAGPVLASAA